MTTVNERISTSQTIDMRDIYVERHADGNRWVIADDLGYYGVFWEMDEALLTFEAACFYELRDIKRVIKFGRIEIERGAGINWGSATKAERDMFIINNICNRMDGYRPAVSKGCEKWVRKVDRHA